MVIFLILQGTYDLAFFESLVEFRDFQYFLVDLLHSGPVIDCLNFLSRLPYRPVQAIAFPFLQCQPNTIQSLQILSQKLPCVFESLSVYGEKGEMISFFGIQ